jgi:type II secretory pathway pseudopilin PulG
MPFVMAFGPRFTINGRPILLRERAWEFALILAIMGTTWAVAVPRLARGSTMSPEELQLTESLSVLRSAIEQYRLDHQGQFPSADRFIQQLALYTSASGLPSPVADSVHTFGPYLQIKPYLPVGRRAGLTAVGGQGTPDIAWLYHEKTGRIRAHTAPDETDGRGVPFSEY